MKLYFYYLISMMGKGRTRAQKKSLNLCLLALDCGPCYLHSKWQFPHIRDTSVKRFQISLFMGDISGRNLIDAHLYVCNIEMLSATMEKRRPGNYVRAV